MFVNCKSVYQRRRMRAVVANTIVALLGATGLIAGPNAMPRLMAAAPEPNGGNWKTIVVESGAAFALPEPPRRNTRQLNAELKEIVALQKAMRGKGRSLQPDASIQFWDTGAVVRWNEVARGLVAKYRKLPPLASRAYALLGVAQYDALVVAWNNKYRFNRPAPFQLKSSIKRLAEVPSDPSYPSEHAVVAAASATVLADLFPEEAGALQSMVQDEDASRMRAGVSFRSDITAGDELGRAVAAQVLERARSDGADALFDFTPPSGEGFFTGTDPVLPSWGRVRPWLVPDITTLRPGPPPAYNSAEFRAALAEVRQISDTRTPEQLRIAEFWADGPGTATPPGHWNQTASDLIMARDLNELRAARIMALMNMAQMDASINSWDTKYTYYLLRPYQADPAITTPVGRPNFPSYTSGHASFSGAASEVLSYFFPDQAGALRAAAEEAAMSRLFGGIHYRFDNEVGLERGRFIGGLATQRAASDGG